MPIRVNRLERFGLITHHRLRPLKKPGLLHFF